MPQQILGRLVINSDGAILKSGGDLQNDERASRVASNILGIVRGHPDLAGAGVRRVSLHYSDHAYILLQSPPSHQIHVIKVAREANPLQLDPNEIDFEEE